MKSERFSDPRLLFGFGALVSVTLAVVYLSQTSLFANHLNVDKPSLTTLTPTMTPTPTSSETLRPQWLQSGWDFVPATDITNDGLLVHPLGFALVDQNGRTAGTNSPINLAGFHLEKVSGDFHVIADLDRKGSKKATLQLYAQVPIIADEFRIERESVRIDLTEGIIVVNIWDGSSQKAKIAKSFRFDNTYKVTLEVTSEKNRLNFKVNDAPIGDLPDQGVFKKGQIWFGLDAEGGDWLLTDLKVNKLDKSSFETVDTSKLEVSSLNPTGLQFLASKKRSDFVVGAAMALGPMVSDPDYSSVALDKNMFGSFTAENDMKMINLQPQRNVYDFKKADALVKIAQQNGINNVHGHTLVFGEANPPWFNSLPTKTEADKKVIEEIMTDHITRVVKHFGTKVRSWDVINEPLADYDNFDARVGEIYREHKWYKAIGKDYIIKALQTAHKANPEAILFINEYGLEADDERWHTFLEMLKSLKGQLVASSIPVDKVGVGFQAHVYDRGDKISATTLRKHFQELAKLGFKAQISEMDVYSDDGDQVQAAQYASVLDACIGEANCIAYRVWILSDRYNVFKDDDGSIQFGRDGLFGSDMKPRPAIAKMQAVLNQ